MFLKTVLARWPRVGAIALLGIGFMAFALTPAVAQTRYVTDQWSLPVRSGPGTDRKIFTFLKSSDRVQVIANEEEWSQVALSDGREGWVLSRYLTVEKPNKLALAELQTQHSSLSTQAADLTQENTQLKSENTGLKERVQSLESELSALKTDRDALQKKADASREEIRKYMVFFVSGAAILFFGILLGFFSRKPRRKSMLM